MNTNFPDDLFPISQNINSIHRYQINEGKKIAKNKSIIFCGIARDVGFRLQRNIECIKRTGEGFKKHKTFIYENDSLDSTVEILEKNKSDVFDYVSEMRSDKNYREKIDNREDPWHYNRCIVLAECRNKYIQHINSLEEKYDYICILDLDLKGGWSYDGIYHSIFIIEQEKNIGCVSAYGVLADKSGKHMLEDHHNSDYIMYDSFAFRPLNYDFGVHLLSTPSFNNLHFNNGQEPIEVCSNFGGMAIYKQDAISGCSYGAKEWREGYVDPDHVVFNRQVRNNGWKVLLNPSMIVSYSNHKFSGA